MRPVFEYEQTSPETLSLVIDGVKSGEAIIQDEGRFLVNRREHANYVLASFDRLYDAKRFLEEMIEDDIRQLAHQDEIDALREMAEREGTTEQLFSFRFHLPLEDDEAQEK